MTLQNYGDTIRFGTKADDTLLADMDTREDKTWCCYNGLRIVHSQSCDTIEARSQSLKESSSDLGPKSKVLPGGLPSTIFRLLGE